MKNLFSRFGGSAIIIGQGKASNKNLPEDQSFESMLETHAIQMNGYAYLSSYQILPEFMGAYKHIPKTAIKVAEIEHDFNEVLLQYDVRVTSSVYILKTDYYNVFAVFIKTDASYLETIFGKMEPTYDCVLIFEVLGKSENEVKNGMPDILNAILITLIFEMDVHSFECDFKPSKTPLGKKINTEKLLELYNKVQTISSREKIKEILIL
jgi:hypothetical protein